MKYEIRELDKLEIVIHRLQQRTLNEFIHTHCVDWDGVKPMWCQGLVIVSYALERSEMLAESEFNGCVHFQEVCFAEMPEYKDKLKRSDMSYESPVINAQNDDMVNAIASYIKTTRLNTTSTQYINNGRTNTV